MFFDGFFVLFIFLSYSLFSKNLYQIFHLSTAHNNLDSIFYLFKGQKKYLWQQFGLVWFFSCVFLFVCFLGFFFLNISSCLLLMKKFLKLLGFFSYYFSHGNSSTLFRENNSLICLVVWTLNSNPLCVVRTFILNPQLMPCLHCFF